MDPVRIDIEWEEGDEAYITFPDEHDGSYFNAAYIRMDIHEMRVAKLVRDNKVLREHLAKLTNDH